MDRSAVELGVEDRGEDVGDSENEALAFSPTTAITSILTTATNSLFTLPVTMLTDLARFPTSHGSSSSNAESMLIRVHRRSESLREFFRLPKGESLLEEFHCALAKTLLFQGRMYIFERYICFYANVFGLVKKKVIALAEVKEMVRKRHVGFPNSIQITHSEINKVEFFTSFLARDDAYQLLLTTWKQNRTSKSLRKFPPTIVEVRNEGEGGNRRGSDPTAGPSGGEIQPNIQYGQHQRSITYDYVADIHQKNEIIEEKNEGIQLHPDAVEIAQVIELEEDEDLQISEDNDDDDEDNWQFYDKESPEIKVPMQEVLEAEFEISTIDFANEILADSSSAFYDYHNRRGDRNLHISLWKRTSNIGHVRDLIFVSPTNSRIGPAQTSCSQIQRAGFYKNDHLVFETSQVMSDIPFGDTFTVETRWDITSIGTNRCKMVIRCHIPFSKKIWIKAMIESSTLKSLKEGMQEFVQITQAKVAEINNQIPLDQQLMTPIQSINSARNMPDVIPAILNELRSQANTPQPILERASQIQQQQQQIKTDDVTQIQTNKNSLLQLIHFINSQFKEFGMMIIVILATIAFFVNIYSIVYSRQSNQFAEIQPVMQYDYTQKHVEMLQMELRLMQDRLEVMSREFSILSTQLTSKK